MFVKAANSNKWLEFVVADNSDRNIIFFNLSRIRSLLFDNVSLLNSFSIENIFQKFNFHFFVSILTIKSKMN